MVGGGREKDLNFGARATILRETMQSLVEQATALMAEMEKRQKEIESAETRMAENAAKFKDKINLNVGK